MKCDVMISSNDQLVLCRVCLQPCIEGLDFFQFARVGEVPCQFSPSEGNQRFQSLMKIEELKPTYIKYIKYETSGFARKGLNPKNKAIETSNGFKLFFTRRDPSPRLHATRHLPVACVPWGSIGEDHECHLSTKGFSETISRAFPPNQTTK